MTANATVQTLDTLRTRLNHLHDRDGLSWRKIASQGEFSGIPPSTLHAIARQGREPKNHAHRHALGLPPVAIPVEPCPDCGRVHDQLRMCNEQRQRDKRTRANGWTRPAAWVHLNDRAAYEAALQGRGFSSLQQLVDEMIDEWRNES